MVHPAIDTSGFEKGSAFRSYLERNRAHSLAAEAGLRAGASEIRQLVIATGHYDPRVRLDARRISRPLIHAADLAIDQARMFQLCLDIYRGVFPPVHSTTGARTQHNANA